MLYKSKEFQVYLMGKKRSNFLQSKRKIFTTVRIKLDLLRITNTLHQPKQMDILSFFSKFHRE
jgi:hypothetical protein